MFDFFYELEPLTQAIIASTLTFSMTTLGAAFVFFFKKVNQNIMDAVVALSSGIMLAAAFFSLLLPSIEQAENLNLNAAVIVTISIIGGALLLIAGDKVSQKHISCETSSFKRVLLLIVSIVLHNIPEGMAIGVAFGSIIYNLEGATVMAAITIAIGIGIQNIPEGAAISIPLRREGLSRFKSFMIGMLSGIVEPFAAIIGVILVLKVKLILPYLLAFAAGAMIFVVIEELIPESLANKHKNLMALLSLIGFVFMMILEIGL